MQSYQLHHYRSIGRTDWTTNQWFEPGRAVTMEGVVDSLDRYFARRKLIHRLLQALGIARRSSGAVRINRLSRLP